MNVSAKRQQLQTTLTMAPVVAVVVVESAQDAVPLARALVSGTAS